MPAARIPPRTDPNHHTPNQQRGSHAIRKPSSPSVTVHSPFHFASAPSMPGPLLHGPLLPFLPPPQGSCSASLSGGKDGRGTVKVEVVGATDISHCDHETRKERSPGEGSGDLCKAAFRAFSPLHDQITSTCQRRRINPEEASPSGGSLRCHSRGRKKNDFTPVCKCTH